MVDGLMVDTGPVCARAALLPQVLAYKPEQVFLTHFHEDHAGNATLFSERLQIPLYRSPATMDEWNRLVLPKYRRLIWGNKREKMRGNDVPELIRTPNFQFYVLPTPGHSPDHVSLVEAERGWLFAGDMFLGTRLHYGMRGESVLGLIQSLRKVLAYPIVTVFCGQAGIVPNGREALTRKLDYLEWLVNETIRLNNQGCDEGEIAKRLLPPNPIVTFFSGGEMSPIHLIRSIVEERKGE
jgi:glyoxylase-like metal-dependent hydrolase (beta-lactamase superfamily II)